MKQYIYRILEPGEEQSTASRIVNFAIFSLIILSIVMIVFQSFKSFSTKHKMLIEYSEIIIVMFFTIEYILRIWIADLKYATGNAFTKRIKYIFSVMAIIDLAAILPFFLPLFLPFNLMFLRVLRIARVFRVFKLQRYSAAMGTIIKVVRSRKDELLSSLFIMSLVLVMASIMMYYVENDAQPEAFPNIAASFWWAICTLTTVGYGDIYPVTVAGKIIASIITILGIGIIALPTAIISAGFLEEMRSKNETVCPHCGEKIHETNHKY